MKFSFCWGAICDEKLRKKKKKNESSKKKQLELDYRVYCQNKKKLNDTTLVMNKTNRRELLWELFNLDS